MACDQAANMGMMGGEMDGPDPAGEDTPANTEVKP